MNQGNLNISSSDTELIESYKRGNKQAFNFIVMKHQKSVYKFIIRILRDHDNANDAVQETFIKLYNSLAKFRGDSRLLTYIYRIAYNTTMNHLKKVNKENDRIINIEAIREDLNDFQENDDIQRETVNITKSFNCLPPKQKAVFMMRFYDNLSYEEISGITGTSVGGLKANYFQAIRNLKTLIKADNEKQRG